MTDQARKESGSEPYCIVLIADNESVHLTRWLSAQDDGDAIEEAKRIVKKERMEVWQGNRLVDIFSPAKTAG